VVARWQVDISMHKGSSEVDLLGGQQQLSSQHLQQPDSVPVYYQSIGVKEVNTLNLLVTSNTKLTLQFTDQAIWILFNLECPHTQQDIHPRLSWHNIPDLHSLECLNLFVTGFPKSITVGTVHSLFPVGVSVSLALVASVNGSQSSRVLVSLS
jgi:hypothetical protein